MPGSVLTYRIQCYEILLLMAAAIAKVGEKSEFL